MTPKRVLNSTLKTTWISSQLQSARSSTLSPLQRAWKRLPLLKKANSFGFSLEEKVLPMCAQHLSLQGESRRVCLRAACVTKAASSLFQAISGVRTSLQAGLHLCLWEEPGGSCIFQNDSWFLQNALLKRMWTWCSWKQGQACLPNLFTWQCLCWALKLNFWPLWCYFVLYSGNMHY